MHYCKKILCIAVGVLATGASSIFAQNAGQPKTLEEALREIQALKARLNTLEQVVQGLAEKSETKSIAPIASTNTAPSTASKTSPATEAKLDEQKDGFVKWNELVFGKSHIKIYGMLRLDAIYDDSHPNNTQIPSFIRSEDPKAPAAVFSPRNSSDLTIHPRLTRLGMDLTGPEIATLGGAKMSGKVEIDFYNGGLAESREAVRLRHGYLKLDWDEASILAGQTSDVISPQTPIVNPDFVMWGSGNTGDRRPQLRGEFAPHVGKGKIILQGEAGMTGADDNLIVSTNGFRAGEISGLPTLQARLAYSHPFIWEKQNIEIGIWGHRSWEKVESDVPTNQIALVGREFDSEAFGIDWFVPLYRDKLWVKGELWEGKNLADIRGGILQGINTGTGREIRARGGWSELGYKPCKYISLHGGYSFDDPRAEDLPKSGNSIGKDLNSIYYAAVHTYFDPIEIGLQYLHWRTKYVGGIGDGVDNRFQAFISYKF